MNLTLGRAHNPRELMVSPITFANWKSHSPQFPSEPVFRNPLALGFKAPGDVPKPEFSVHRTSNSCALASKCIRPTNSFRAPMTRTRSGNNKKNAIMHRYTLTHLTGIAKCGSVGGMKWEGTRVRIKQPIASYFESHHHRREIFQSHWREGAGAWEWRPR